MADSIVRKPIPKTGELLPAIGLGTWQTFDVGATEIGTRRRSKKFCANSSASAAASSTRRRCTASPKASPAISPPSSACTNNFFSRPKFGPAGATPASARWKNLSSACAPSAWICMQVHNLVDYRTHLTTLRAWKEQGKVRYIGVTHYTASAYDRARARDRRRRSRLRPAQLFPGRARSGTTPLAARRRQTTRRAREPAASPKARCFAKCAASRCRPGPKKSVARAGRSFFSNSSSLIPPSLARFPPPRKVEHLVDNMQAMHGPLPEAPGASAWRAT